MPDQWPRLREPTGISRLPRRGLEACAGGATGISRLPRRGRDTPSKLVEARTFWPGSFSASRMCAAFSASFSAAASCSARTTASSSANLAASAKPKEGEQPWLKLSYWTFNRSAAADAAQRFGGRTTRYGVDARSINSALLAFVQNCVEILRGPL